MRHAAFAELAAADAPAARRRPETCAESSAPARRSRYSAKPSEVASRASSRSAGCASSRSPARFTSRSDCCGSKAKTATSISSITLRSSAVASSAPSRWSRSVAAIAFTCCITSPSGSFGLSDAGADRVVAFAHRFQQIGERAQAVRRHARARRSRSRASSQYNDDIERPLHACRNSRRTASRIAQAATAGKPPASASSSTRVSWLSLKLMATTARSAAGAGTARCGSGPRRWRHG